MEQNWSVSEDFISFQDATDDTERTIDYESLINNIAA